MEFRLAFLLFLFVGGPSAHALDVENPDVRAFINSMVNDHSYDRGTLEDVLQQATVQGTILEAIDRPAERTKEWHEYRDIFVTDERVKAGAAFWREHSEELNRISEESGVAVEILVGIIGVETYFGRITGKYRVLDALATLAFEYPPRANFFRSELEQYLLLVREEGMEATDATGSYAGAMGSVDSSADGKRDIWSNWTDVIGSIANYFVRHGWRENDEIVAQAVLSSQWQGELPENTLKPQETVTSLSHQGVLFATSLPGDQQSQLLTLEGDDGEEHWVGFHNFFVITRYNRSVMYALAVHQLGQEIAIEVKRGKS
jgi:membrane-bound lytic murein transglycosylase B